MDGRVTEACLFVQSRTSKRPELGLVLGSGLGFLSEKVEDADVIPYVDIPHFPRSTVPGHEGKLVLGRLFGRQVCVLSGRFHLYEGWSPSDIRLVVHVLRCLGLRKMLLTNAAGAINTQFEPGDLVLVNDVINFMFRNPLRGPNDSDVGPRFPDMLAAFDLDWMERIKNSVSELKQGVYLAVTGPSYETPAEIRAFRKFGADLVGMSTVPEIIACAHAGIKVVVLSCVTNMAAGILEKPLSHEDVVEVATKVRTKFTEIVAKAVETA